MISAITAIIGISIAFFREYIEKWLRRRMLVRLLETNEFIRGYLNSVYQHIVGDRWYKWRRYILLTSLIVGFLSPLVYAIVLSSLPVKSIISNLPEIFTESFVLAFFLFNCLFFVIFPLLLFLESYHPILLKILEILKTIFVGLLLNIVWSSLVIMHSQNYTNQSYTNSKFLELIIIAELFSILVGFVIIMVIDIKRNMIFKHHVKHHTKENLEEIEEKRLSLPIIEISLENGDKEIGKLIEFYDPDFIVIKKDDESELAILWNKIIGISFKRPTKDR